MRKPAHKPQKYRINEFRRKKNSLSTKSRRSFSAKKNFAGEEKSFPETSSTISGDFVDKYFAMCRWALTRNKVLFKCCHAHLCTFINSQVFFYFFTVHQCTSPLRIGWLFLPKEVEHSFLSTWNNYTFVCSQGMEKQGKQGHNLSYPTSSLAKDHSHIKT